MIRRLLCGWMLLGGMPSIAQATCPRPVSAAELARFISKADVAFAQMDAEAFRAARWEADKSIPCLGQAIQTGQAAAYYRMQALGSFMDQDHAKTVGWFKSVFAVAPQYVLPETLAPDGHPMRIDFEVAQGAPRVSGEPVPRPALGVIRVDGKTAAELPQDRPFLWQHTDGDGRVRATAVVQPGMQPPRYATLRGYQAIPRDRRSGPVTRVRRNRSHGLSVPLAVVSGCTAIASGVSYAVATSKAQRFWSRATPTSKLASLQNQTNAWVWISVGTGAVAAGTGVAAVVSGTW